MYRVAGALGGSGGSAMNTWNGIMNPRGQFPGQDRTLILVVGKDYNHDSKGIAYTKDARADTIMLLSADLEHKKLFAIGVPRDTRVEAPDGVTGKINATLQRGGVDLLKQTLKKEFDVTVDHYVLLKADAVKAMVDAVGGVNVEPIDNMFYEDFWGGLKIDLKPGPQRIDGTQAVGFVRFRKSGDHRYGPKGEIIEDPHPPSKEEGDLRRAERQQQLVHAVAEEALRPNNLIRADKIIDVAFQQIETDLSRTQVLALATIFKSSASASLSGSTIPGSDERIDGIYYWKPDLDRARLTINWLLRGDEMAGRQLTRIAIYDGTPSRRGGEVAKELEGLGYTAIRSGRPHRNDNVTEVIYRKAAYEDAAREIATKFGITNVRKDPTDANAYWLPEIRLVLKEDADHLVTTP